MGQRFEIWEHPMLNEMTVRNAKAKDRDYKLADTEGLHLYVTKKGHRSWHLKYRFGGKERRLVLGSYPQISLKEARELKAAARKHLVPRQHQWHRFEVVN